jgi:Protein of unknown function (DUF1676)
LAAAVFLAIKRCSSLSSTSSFDLVTRVTHREIMVNCAKAFIILGFISTSILATPTTITSPPVSDNVVFHSTRDDLKSIFGQCLHRKDVSKCLKRRVVDVIDDVTQSKDPMSATFFNLQFNLNKNPQFKENRVESSDSSRTFEDLISQKLKNLLESRVIQVKLADDTKENEEVSGDGNEARKKKGGNGGKHGMMMSGKMFMNLKSLVELDCVLI